ncbi:MAG: DUF427 domain-containing protein [Rhodospirillales bacterium]
MAKASWNGAVVALSASYRTVEDNVYFPPDTVRHEHLRPSSHTSICPWKGVAHYFDLVVDDHVNGNAAWYYPDPKPAAAEIKDHVAFWKGVTVER